MISLNFEYGANHSAEEGGFSMTPEGGPGHYHETVLRDEAVEFLAPAPGKVIVDGTLGGGGHSKAFLEEGAKVIGLDQDPDALVYAAKRIGQEERFMAVHANFSELESVLDQLGMAQIDGGFLDLGVSSWQLDTPERGFSFMRDGPLDMRMDTCGATSAADVVNNATAEELEDIFRHYGEEPAARRIAAKIVQDRMRKPFATTLDLVRTIETVAPRHGKTHPATRVFQALRIAVNHELEVLTSALEQFGRRLAPGGRFGVITFHSLEDRIVKTYFKTRSAEWIDRPEWAEARPNPDRIFKLVKNKPVVASDAEQKRNPRSRSAKLRIVEKI